PWRLGHALGPQRAPCDTPVPAELRGVDRDLPRRTHATTQRVTEDVVERLHFNTAIAAVMELVGALGDVAGAASPATLREAVDATLRLLAPFVPHVANELWERTGHPETLDAASWPAADPAALVRQTVD